MKALLLKDWYMAIKYCRVYLLLAVLFMTISVFSESSMDMFYIIYPCLLCGMIPVNLLSYDERSGWIKYSAALPYTKVQIVTSKYIFGILCQLVMLIATGIVQAVKTAVAGVFDPIEFLFIMFTVLMVSALSGSMALPFVFRYGTEKGRMAYLITVGVICAVSMAGNSIIAKIMLIPSGTALMSPVFIIIGVLIYFVSWKLSCTFFKNREL
ncbi:MAG: ABC-2 transporter permease [Clostridia bacterium]|nr:ABC-2 transporter permease [Clostridia bacterium]MBR4955747.1 ABC-2 transporter permease [Clostridia bacterium]MBR5903867.1 ABC-2 transporter permease [Clostridia bacterium]